MIKLLLSFVSPIFKEMEEKILLVKKNFSEEKIFSKEKFNFFFNC